jgi:hypothetical protein
MFAATARPVQSHRALSRKSVTRRLLTHGSKMRAPLLLLPPAQRFFARVDLPLDPAWLCPSPTCPRNAWMPWCSPFPRMRRRRGSRWILATSLPLLPVFQKLKSVRADFNQLTIFCISLSLQLFPWTSDTKLAGLGVSKCSDTSTALVHLLDFVLWFADPCWIKRTENKIVQFCLIRRLATSSWGSFVSYLGWSTAGYTVKQKSFCGGFVLRLGKKYGIPTSWLSSYWQIFRNILGFGRFGKMSIFFLTWDSVWNLLRWGSEVFPDSSQHKTYLTSA